MPQIFQNTLLSWGRLRASPHTAIQSSTQEDLVQWMQKKRAESILAHGLGRSYGDSCLNTNEHLIYMRSLDKLISFDAKSGILTAMAGVSLAEIIEFALPRGWFLPVSPGTKFVTLGGAIANDVHGKNHHLRSSLGAHLLHFSLLRSSGEILTCDPSSELFQATIGGLGLTGVILQASIQLIPVASAYIDQEIVKFESLEEFFSLK